SVGTPRAWRDSLADVEARRPPLHDPGCGAGVSGPVRGGIGPGEPGSPGTPNPTDDFSARRTPMIDSFCSEPQTAVPSHGSDHVTIDENDRQAAAFPSVEPIQTDAARPVASHDPVDLREALFNDGGTGPANRIQVPLERITILKGFMLDVDPGLI